MRTFTCIVTTKVSLTTIATQNTSVIMLVFNDEYNLRKNSRRFAIEKLRYIERYRNIIELTG